MQRTQRIFARLHLIGFRGGGSCHSRHECHDGVDPRVYTLDLFQMRGQCFARRKLFRSDQPGYLDRAHKTNGRSSLSLQSTLKELGGSQAQHGFTASWMVLTHGCEAITRQIGYSPDPGAPERAGHHDHKGLRARATIAVLLGCALRRSAVAELTDGRASGGFTPQATGDARHANTPELSASCLTTPSACRLSPLAVAATDDGRLAPELAAGIAAVKSAKSNRRQVWQTGPPLGRPRRSRRTSRPRSGCTSAPSSPCSSAVRCAGPRWRRSPMGAVRADSRRRRRSPHGTRTRAGGGVVTGRIASAISDRASRAPCGCSAWRVVSGVGVPHARANRLTRTAIDWSGMRALSEWPTIRQEPRRLMQKRFPGTNLGGMR